MGVRDVPRTRLQWGRVRGRIPCSRFGRASVPVCLWEYRIGDGQQTGEGGRMLESEH